MTGTDIQVILEQLRQIEERIDTIIEQKLELRMAKVQARSVWTIVGIVGTIFASGVAWGLTRAEIATNAAEIHRIDTQGPQAPAPMVSVAIERFGIKLEALNKRFDELNENVRAIRIRLKIE